MYAESFRNYHTRLTAATALLVCALVLYFSATENQSNHVQLEAVTEGDAFSRLSSKSNSADNSDDGTAELVSEAQKYHFIVNKNDELKKLLSVRDIRICEHWNDEGVISSDVHCNLEGIQRLSAAYQVENCRAATRSVEQKLMVGMKIEKLATGSAFQFFRGSAMLFAFNMMCDDPDWKKHGIPKVLSNGDTHPENFGTMMAANGRIVFGINDFDQAFLTPFTWDLTRGASGFLLGCLDRGWDEYACVSTAGEFVKGYLNIAARPGCMVDNEERYIEGSKAVIRNPLLKKLFLKARNKAKDELRAEWLSGKMSVDLNTDKFVESEKIKPLPEEYNFHFQESLDAYLFHGVAALALYPNDGDFYKVLSVARKLGSGTGSIGLHRYYVLIKGSNATNGRVVLQFKETVGSVLESFFNYKITTSQEGKRISNGERSAWPYANVFFGWTTYPLRSQKSYIVTERDIESVSVNIKKISLDEYNSYAKTSGTALAYYHIRARCAGYRCPLSEAAIVDHESCEGIQSYLRSFEGDFFNEVVGYATDQATDQLSLHRTLQQWIQNHDEPLELLAEV